jgi:hypothetical protein
MLSYKEIRAPEDVALGGDFTEIAGTRDPI